MQSVFTHDLHVHLYGCVEPKSVWQLGRDRWQLRTNALEWYAGEFNKAYGRQPEWLNYWSSEQGIELLTGDYLVCEKTNFARFQASFNLLIALFPLDPNDRSVLRAVLTDDAAARIRYCEYRTIFPHAFSNQDLDNYLKSNALVLLEHDCASYSPRIALSLPRDPGLALIAYEKLRQWMDQNPTLARFFVGIDFCGFEENDPVLSKESLFHRIRTDNKRSPSPLAILLHVGETWETMSPLSALRRVWQGMQVGAHRLGHATIAGITEAGLRGRAFYSSMQETLWDLQWLNSSELFSSIESSDFDQFVSEVVRQLEEVKKQESNKPSFFASEQYLKVFNQLQGVVLRDIANTDVVIESCPTSNLVISGITPAASHPIKRFATSGVHTVIGRDDPGIFGSTFATEENFSRDVAGLSPEEIKRVADTACVSHSLLLAQK